MFIKTKKWLIALIAVFSLFILIGCGGEVLPTGITVEGKAELKIGEIAVYEATMQPAEAKLSVKFTSSDSTILEITEQGAATAKAAGEVTITATSTVAATITGTLKVTVAEVLPTAIDILGVEGVLQGSETTFEVDITPSNATNKTVRWSSSDETVATVDENGVVKGLKVGVVTITATSAADSTIKAEARFEVIEEGTPAGICLSARDHILAQLPKYIDSDFELPTYQNPNLTITYALNGGRPFAANENGVATFKMPAIEADQIQILLIDIVYDGELDGQKFTLETVEARLKLCLDAEDNDFLRIDTVKADIDKYFADYAEKEVTANLELPTEVETDLGKVALQWTTDTGNVLAKDGTYTRPDNATKVMLDVVYSVLSEEGLVLNSDVSHYVVTAHGYTKEEKIEYIKTTDLTQYFQETTREVLGHERLPERDTKFGVAFTWKSGKEDFMNDGGRLLVADFNEDTPVDFTVTLSYDVEGNEFEEELEIQIVVKPFTNDAEAAAFSLSNNAGATLPSHFPFGATDDNKITLPTTVEEFEGSTIAWSSTATLARQDSAYESTSVPQDPAGVTINDPVWSITGNEATLLVQPLRYTETKIVGTITVGENTATYEYVVNVGISEKANTNYIAITKSYSATTGVANQRHDFVSQLGAWDFPYSTQTGYSYGQMAAGGSQNFSQNGYAGAGQGAAGHTWSGLTYFWDDPVTGIRHQVFPSAQYLVEFSGVYSAEEETAGTPSFNNAGQTLVREGFGKLAASQFIGNWGNLFWNNSEVDIRIPIAYLNATASNISGVGRESYVSFDGYRYGAVYDAEGNCIFANCELQDYKVDAAGAFVLAEDGSKQINYKLDEDGNQIPCVDEEGNEIKDAAGNTVYEIEQVVAVFATLEAYLLAHQDEWVVYQLDENTRLFKTFEGQYLKMTKQADGTYLETKEVYDGEMPTTVATVTDEEGTVSNIYRYPSYLVIPAGGYGFAVKTQNNTEQTNYIPICTIGNKMTFVTYKIIEGAN